MMDWGNWLIQTFHLETTKFHWAIAGSYVLVAAVVIFSLYFIASVLTASMLRIPTKTALIYFGYIYLPFAYIMFIRDILVVYFVDGSIIQVWFAQAAAAGHQWVLLIVPSLEIFMIIISAAWSIFLAYRVVQIAWHHENQNKVPDWTELLAGAVPHILLILGLTWYWISLLAKEQLGPFAALGIPPWVPYGIPVLTLLVFMIAHYRKLLTPLEHELEVE